MWPFSRSLKGKHAPEITGDAWFNFDALPKAAQDRIHEKESVRFNHEIQNTVVLIDFWDYSSAACINALPYLKEWWKLYKEYNFLIIGVHTPEYVFAQESDKVESAVLRFELNYPVVSDSDYATWKRYHNKVWPRKLLVHHTGKVRYDRKGEVNYQELEQNIQEALLALHPDAVFTDPFVPPHEDKPLP